MPLPHSAAAAAAALAMLLLAAPPATAQRLDLGPIGSGLGANGGATTTFGFGFQAPVPSALYSSLTLGGTFTLTAAAGAGASVAAPTGLATAFLTATGRLGAQTFQLATFGATTCATAAGTTSTCVLGPTTVTFAPQAFDRLDVLLAYAQTGDGSSLRFAGAATLATVVPEPSTAALVWVGLVGVGLGARRRRVAA